MGIDTIRGKRFSEKLLRKRRLTHWFLRRSTLETLHVLSSNDLHPTKQSTRGKLMPFFVCTPAKKLSAIRRRLRHGLAHTTVREHQLSAVQESASNTLEQHVLESTAQHDTHKSSRESSPSNTPPDRVTRPPRSKLLRTRNHHKRAKPFGS